MGKDPAGLLIYKRQNTNVNIQSSYPLGFFQCMFTTLQTLDNTTEAFEVYIAK